MIVIKNRIRLISIALTFLILFQSCRVYHKENVSIEKAVEEGKRVRIMTTNGQKLKFKKILLDSSQYYGVKKVKGETKHILIQPNDIESLRLHNKTMSIIYGTGIGMVVAFVGAAVYVIGNWDGPILSGPIRSPN